MDDYLAEWIAADAEAEALEAEDEIREDEIDMTEMRDGD